MQNTLAPSYQKQFDVHWLLWYATSNTYSVVDTNFKANLDLFLGAKDKSEFATLITTKSSKLNPTTVFQQIEAYLKSCNISSSKHHIPRIGFNNAKVNFSRYYNLNNNSICIGYDTDLVAKIIHPQIAHLEAKISDTTQTHFDIYLEGENLCLFKNQQLIIAVPKRDYHLLQGKIVMELLNLYHGKTTEDWLGTIHGCTVTDGHSALLLIGASGKGKSTLSTLLWAHGFELLADDVSPILASDSKFYFNPSAVSIKSGAFGALKSLIPNFNSLPEVEFNPSKGSLKYIPTTTPNQLAYPCNTIFMVNYVPKAKTQIQPVDIDTLLQTLIPESWISSQSNHPETFISWLSQINAYSVTYSNTDSIIKEITTILKSLR